LRSAPKIYLRLNARRTLTLVIGCLGLVWGIRSLPSSEAADEFWAIEGQILRFETFSKTTLARILESQVSRDLNACDTHSQRAMLLMEMPLAEAALQSGTTNEFDRLIEALETRTRRMLSCTPRESFAWLLTFNLEVLHGLLNERAFDLLAMSYETSPNEAWISIRRIIVAMPIVLVAPEPLRQRILFEFRQLIRYGFVEEAARSYSSVPGPIRSLLQTQIDQLDPREQKVFSDALQSLRS
jgi:hypothetical protein